MTRRMVHVALVALCLTALAVPSSAQVFTGRIDVTAKDGTGAILPGVTVELTGTQTANAVTDTRGEAHFLNLAPGRYAVAAKLSGFNDYKNDNVPVGAGSIISLPVDHDSRRRDREGRRHGADADYRSQETDRVDQRVARRAAEHPVVTRSVGRPSDGARDHRGPRERRRRRIGPAVELSVKGRSDDRQHVEHRRHRDHRHGRARARRRPTTTSTCSRKCRSRRAARIRRTRRRACSSTSCFAAAPTGGVPLAGTTTRTTISRPTTCPRRSPARCRVTTAWSSTRTTAWKAAGRCSRIVCGCGVRTARPTRRSRSTPTGPTRGTCFARTLAVRAWPRRMPTKPAATPSARETARFSRTTRPRPRATWRRTGARRSLTSAGTRRSSAAARRPLVRRRRR